MPDIDKKKGIPSMDSNVICQKTEACQQGWELISRKVRFFVTENGGHTAPVIVTDDSGKSISPYYLTQCACAVLSRSLLSDSLRSHGL